MTPEILVAQLISRSLRALIPTSIPHSPSTQCMSTTVQVLPNSTTNAHSVNDAHGAARPSQPRRNRPPKHRPATDGSASLAEAAQSEGAASGSAPGRGRGRGGPTRGRGRPHENGQGRLRFHPILRI
jgi:hypothetical protein